MSGTINLALTQQFDLDGNPLGGGLLYFFVASTTTPQSAFQDIALTIPHPNPVVLDASGRVPMFYLADGNIKIRLASKAGVTVIAADNLLVIGPSTGSSGGAGVDPNTVLQTGDIKARFSIADPLPGFVRCNGGTVGNAISGSTERANADCQALFEYLWSTNVLGVFSGTTPNRGATANGDWLANKRIVTPDLRGRTIAGLDDMGITGPASRLTSSFFGVSGLQVGNAGGSESRIIAAANLPGHSHNGGGTTGNENTTITHNFSWGGTTTDISADHTHQYGSAQLGGVTGGGGAIGAGGTQTTSGASNGHTHAYSGSGTTSGQNQNHQHGYSFTTDSGNGLSNSAFAIASPAMVLMFYIKL